VESEIEIGFTEMFYEEINRWNWETWPEQCQHMTVSMHWPLFWLVKFVSLFHPHPFHSLFTH